VATSPEPAHTDHLTAARFGGIELDLRSGLLSRNGTKNRIQGQPLQLLELLLQQPGQIVTREQIQQHLWPDGTVVEFEHSVNAAVKRLREALGDDAEKPTFIETIPRKGYRLLPLVESVKPVKREMFRRYLIVPVILIVMLGGLIAYVRLRPRSLPPHIHSLAVLPLNNLSGDSTQEYLADGMTEALVGRLARIHDLRVISRTSVMRFKDTKLSAPEIARTLGVDALVEGSVIRQGNRIRVHAQLIRGSTDEHLWSDEYDGEFGDVLALQSEVAQSIARRVEVTVTGAERARLVAARHISPEAYESYLKGQGLVGGPRADIEQSIAYFEEAIKKDATFAQAYVGLAYAYDRLGSTSVGGPPKETHPKMMSAARKAIELDPDLAEPHVLLAGAYQKQWQWSDAEAEYKLALELSPNDAGAHEGYAKWLLYQGRTEDALAWSERAREIDPLERGASTGWIMFHARHYDEAIQEFRSVLAVDPDSVAANWFLGFALVAKGQSEEAIPVLQKALSLSDGNPVVMGVLVSAYAHAGRRAEALRLVDELKQREQKSYVSPAAFVNAYLGLGDNEQALAWLEKAYKEQSNILELLKVHPYFDPLRGDPRFVDLVHRVGLDKPR
jgi:TolB-like protein/tetratricopeptide (TPR) repeat protein/DNA-binding winged helix-turn-helix (wHTH) protein